MAISVDAAVAKYRADRLAAAVAKYRADQAAKTGIRPTGPTGLTAERKPVAMAPVRMGLERQAVGADVTGTRRVQSPESRIQSPELAGRGKMGSVPILGLGTQAVPAETTAMRAGTGVRPIGPIRPIAAVPPTGDQSTGLSRAMARMVVPPERVKLEPRFATEAVSTGMLPTKPKPVMELRAMEPERVQTLAPNPEPENVARLREVEEKRKASIAFGLNPVEAGILGFNKGTADWAFALSKVLPAPERVRRSAEASKAYYQERQRIAAERYPVITPLAGFVGDLARIGAAGEVVGALGISEGAAGLAARLGGRAFAQDMASTLAHGAGTFGMLDGVNNAAAQIEAGGPFSVGKLTQATLRGGLFGMAAGQASFGPGAGGLLKAAAAGQPISALVKKQLSSAFANAAVFGGMAKLDGAGPEDVAMAAAQGAAFSLMGGGNRDATVAAKAAREATNAWKAKVDASYRSARAKLDAALAEAKTPERVAQLRADGARLQEWHDKAPWDLDRAVQGVTGKGYVASLIPDRPLSWGELDRVWGAVKARAKVADEWKGYEPGKVEVKAKVKTGPVPAGMGNRVTVPSLGKAEVKVEPKGTVRVAPEVERMLAEQGAGAGRASIGEMIQAQESQKPKGKSQKAKLETGAEARSDERGVMSGEGKDRYSTLPPGLAEEIRKQPKEYTDEEWARGMGMAGSTHRNWGEQEFRHELAKKKGSLEFGQQRYKNQKASDMGAAKWTLRSNQAIVRDIARMEGELRNVENTVRPKHLNPTGVTVMHGVQPETGTKAAKPARGADAMMGEYVDYGGFALKRGEVVEDMRAKGFEDKLISGLGGAFAKKALSAAELAKFPAEMRGLENLRKAEGQGKAKVEAKAKAETGGSTVTMLLNRQLKELGVDPESYSNDASKRQGIRDAERSAVAGMNAEQFAAFLEKRPSDSPVWQSVREWNNEQVKAGRKPDGWKLARAYYDEVLAPQMKGKAEGTVEAGKGEMKQATSGEVKGQKLEAKSQKLRLGNRPGEFTADRIVTVDGERISDYSVSRNRLTGKDLSGKTRILDFDGKRWTEKGVPVDLEVGGKAPRVTLMPGQGAEGGSDKREVMSDERRGGAETSSKSEGRMTIEGRSAKGEGGADAMQIAKGKLQNAESGMVDPEAERVIREAEGEVREVQERTGNNDLTELNAGFNPLVGMARAVAESRFARSRGIEPGEVNSQKPKVKGQSGGEDISTPGGALKFLTRALGQGAREIWAEAKDNYSVKAAVNRAPLKPGEGQAAVEHLQRAIDEATALLPSVKEGYAQEKGRRISAYDSREKALIEAGKLTAARKAKLRGMYLSGPLFEEGTKPSITPLYGELRPKDLPVVITPKDYNALHRMIREHKGFDAWDNLSVGKALDRLMSGDIPGDVALENLRSVFGNKVINDLVHKKPWNTRAWDEFVSIANIPRTLMSFMDMSAVLRQGAVSTIAHPFAASKAFARSVHFVFSPKDFETYFRDVLPAEEYYPQMRRSRLAITDPQAAGLKGREEAFVSRSLQSIPGLGHLVRASERAYVGYLTKLRVDLFKDWIEVMRSNNEINVNAGPDTRDGKTMEKMADVINTLTGRGEFAEGFGDWSAPANALLFSPRLIMSRVQVMNPEWYYHLWKQDPKLAKRAMVDMAKFVGVGMTVLWLAKQNGAEVEMDPRSSDFGKIRVGNTRWDVWGGHQQYVRVFFQVATNRTKSASGQVMPLGGPGYKPRTRWDVLVDFGVGKLSPPFSGIVEGLKGRDFEGRPLSWSRALLDRVIPLLYQDVIDGWKDAGLGRAVGVGVPGLFGVGANTYKPRPRKLRLL